MVLEAVASRYLPRWLERYYDVDEALQETLIEAWQAGRNELPWLIVCLRNNIRNAIRNARTRITGRRHQQSEPLPWWLQQATGYRRPSETSREPAPPFLAMLAEQLSKLSPRQRRVLMGDEPAGAGSHRMVRLRARRARAA